MFNMPKLYLENIEPENWDRLTAELKLLVFEYYYEGRPSVGSVAHKHSIWKIVMPFVDKDIPGSQDLIQRACKYNHTCNARNPSSSDY
jgi:ribulose-5-phosphate 4-epimerase/fuculose-1-phosphate aldolase